MDTSITASVATFRVFQSSSRTSVTPQSSPPNSKDRMAATPVTEGPLLLSKLANNEITYLQVNDFTRAIMNRSRIWRVSSNELVIPASFSTYWLVTLRGSPHSISRLERTLKGLCKYEVSCDLDLESENVEELDLSLISSPESPKYKKRVLDAKLLIQKGEMNNLLRREDVVDELNDLQINDMSFSVKSDKDFVLSQGFVNANVLDDVLDGVESTLKQDDETKTVMENILDARSLLGYQNDVKETKDENLNVDSRRDDRVGFIRGAEHDMFGPRFSHPLIPQAHISRYYPLCSPMRSWKRELTMIGPANLHQEVTTVGGYIGLRAVKGFLKKT